MHISLCHSVFSLLAWTHLAPPAAVPVPGFAASICLKAALALPAPEAAATPQNEEELIKYINHAILWAECGFRKSAFHHRNLQWRTSRRNGQKSHWTVDTLSIQDMWRNTLCIWHLSCHQSFPVSCKASCLFSLPDGYALCMYLVYSCSPGALASHYLTLFMNKPCFLFPP